jgi:uncharacterized membrane protein
VYYKKSKELHVRVGYMHIKLDQVYRISILLKTLEAVIEIIGGVILFFVTPHFINHWGNVLTRGELSEDPNNFISNFLSHSIHHLSSISTTYAAIYLLTHGVVKLVALAAVLKNKFWGYPLLLVVLAIFIIYQTIQLVHNVTFGLLALNIFDAFVVVLTVIEWRKRIIKYEIEHNSS